ncbi:hypothetical protein [Desulfobulbus elongatus]|uniref:hypothetical protein n=1 Tax=Desulfobulbus elongatus TaxID=53332 RepID=UPI00146FC728|nr:hypothetical protein [Desulfobulbus elongatus]
MDESLKSQKGLIGKALDRGQKSLGRGDFHGSVCAVAKIDISAQTAKKDGRMRIVAQERTPRRIRWRRAFVLAVF